MATETQLREIDRRYIKFKMQRIKRAKKRGNDPVARRHATELIQMLGLNDDTDMPIEEMVELLEENVTGFQYQDRLQQLRGGLHNEWWN